MGKIGNAYSALFWVGCEMESSHFFSCNLSTRRLLGGGIRPFPYSRELIGRDSYFSQINGHDVLKFDVLSINTDQFEISLVSLVSSNCRLEN